MTAATIRPALSADAVRVAAIAHAAYAPYLQRMSRKPAPMDEDYGARIAAGQTWVLEDHGGDVVGLLVLEDHPDHLLLDNVAVDPDRHGQGIGKRLLAFTEEEARRRGYDTVELYTNEVMVENISMYLRLGYVETGRKQDRGYDRVFFRKSL